MKDDFTALDDLEAAFPQIRPLREAITAAYRLLEILFAMARNYQRFQDQDKADAKERDSSATAYYHKDVMALYRDPTVETAFFADPAEHMKFLRSLVNTNQLFFNKVDPDIIFIPNNTAGEAQSLFSSYPIKPLAEKAIGLYAAAGSRVTLTLPFRAEELPQGYTPG